MNRTCNGDFFGARGVRYYRCLMDGAVVVPKLMALVCPNCERLIEHAEDAGELEVKGSPFVVLPNGWKVYLPQPP